MENINEQPVMEEQKEMERKYAYWLCNIPGVGNHTIQKLLEVFGNAGEVYLAGEKSLAQVVDAKKCASILETRVTWNLESEYHRLQQENIGFVYRAEEDYPKRLLQIPDSPYAIFYRGALPREDKLSVAVIGARDCSEYGSYVAGELGRFLAGADVQVISGMARGIDGIAQEAALDAEGTSFGVLGSGVDVCYPRQNKKIYDRLQRQGGVLSIYTPSTPARPQHFPPRNRIVSGLADAIVVVEARQKSGTLITVDMALEQGREVYVIPGRVTDRLSDGCNRLLYQGASVFLSPEEFLREIRHNSSITKRKQDDCKPGRAVGRMLQDDTGKTGCLLPQKESSLETTMEPEQQMVYRVLDFYPMSVEEILGKLDDSITIAKLHMILMSLCVSGKILQRSTGYFCREK